MRDICVVMTVLITLLFGAVYAWQIRAGRIRPTLSTWLIFLSGGGLSFVTYAIAENKDFRSGILNTIDIAFVTIVISAILVWGDRKVRFHSFEKWYLAGVAAIIVYGLLTGNAWNSNALSQVLLVLAYGPTFHALCSQKRNTESFLAWGCSVVAAGFALYPATVGGNTLAAIYAGRALFFSVALLLLMFYYELKHKPL